MSTIDFEGNDIRDCKTVFQLADLLKLDINSLFFFAYNNQKLYTHYEINKKSGGKRKISAPTEALKTTCRKLALYFNEVYSENLPTSVHGFLFDRSIVTNASNHLAKKFVLNIDLENFFETINAGRVIGLLRSYPFYFSNRLSSIITGIVTYENTLPQGSPTSPVISNMICRKLDKDLIRLAKVNNWIYSRYADDITISTNVLSKNLIVKTGKDLSIGIDLKKIISQNGFLINQKKIRLAGPNHSKWVTGVKVNRELNVSRKFIRQVRSLLHRLEKLNLDPEILKKDHSSSLNIIRGKISHIGNIRTKEDLIFIKLYNRLCDLEGDVSKRVPESAKDKYKENIVVIKTTLGYGSGFIITKNIIVTAAHLIGPNDRTVEIAIRKMKLTVESKGANVIHVDQLKDLAILYTNSSSFDGVVFETDFGAKSYDHNTNYVSLGYGGFRASQSLWTDVAVLDQQIVQTEVVDGNTNYFVNNPMWSGMSGGPVISLKSGLVVGYIVYGSTSLQTGQDVKSHVFRSISNVPVEYRPVNKETDQESMIIF
jgi:hypothetical protein